ncbi:TraR/DksA C4-type zinc finger protein [Bacillus fonticola]|uniref:TraR/DksA C4-type zinc finger protein n=1 Tax=Bacillus fonticola TaxID=2728853 RepID=UPI001475EF2A|nr:TraR/DksA C4-type zinc finger protein [Bacillus fonticola]
MHSPQQVAHWKALLEKQKQELLTHSHDHKLGLSYRDEGGELSLYDNHPGDSGTDLYEREKDAALHVHELDELSEVYNALQAIDKGTYGICQVCKKTIPAERLDAIPTAVTCKEHAPHSIPEDRPVEEEILEPAHGPHFHHRTGPEVFDEYDSFQEVARYGTSETPSDFQGDIDDYEGLYDPEEGEGFTEAYETFVGQDFDSGEVRVYPSGKFHEGYEDQLDEEGTDTPFGDLPFHNSDGYVDESDNVKKDD